MEKLMTKEKIQMLKSHLLKAINNKLTKNFSICSFYLLCPKNGQPTQITYNSHPVGKIENAKMTVYDFKEGVWGNSIYKYDLLHEIIDEFHPKPKKKVDGKKSSTNKK